MRARRIIAAGVGVAAAAGLTAFAPATAMAATPAPSCQQAGQTGQKNVYYFNCEQFVAGNPYLTWSGAPIVRGQGTSELWGTCIGGSLPYYITVTWAIAGTSYSATTTLTCSGGGKV